MSEYRIAPAAERDLETIWSYTKRAWGVDQADRYVEFLVTAFVDLASTPLVAPSCKHHS